MLAKNKIGLLHVAKAQLKLTEEDWRAILRTYGGVASSRDLDEMGFKSVMGHLERCGFLSTGKKKNFGTRQGMASAAQVAKIRDLWAQFTAGEGTDAMLGKWLERIFKISSIRFVSAEMAPKVIGALNNMCARGRHTDP